MVVKRRRRKRGRRGGRENGLCEESLDDPGWTPPQAQKLLHLVLKFCIHPSSFHRTLKDSRFRIYPIESLWMVLMLYRGLIFNLVSSENGSPYYFSAFYTQSINTSSARQFQILSTFMKFTLFPQGINLVGSWHWIMYHTHKWHAFRLI